METLLHDLSHAFRLLRRSPGFTAVSVITLALAIGATTAIFSVVYGVLLRPLPYNNPERIVAIHEVNTRGTWSRLADPNFDDFRDQNHSFESAAKYSAYVISVSGGAQPTRTMVASVSPDFLKVFGVQPIIGRDFAPADARKGSAPVALVSDGYWKQPNLRGHRRSSRWLSIPNRNRALHPC
jgi:putative ABC transport system permease protein